MKYLELKEQLLNEINMSPGSLRRAAAEIGARAGMEFEMIVPGASEADDDYDMEPDYDSDESIRSIQDAFDFFYDGDFNSRRDCERLVDKMRDDYNEWLDEQSVDRWESDKVEMIYDWLRYNAKEEDISELLGKEFTEDNPIAKSDYAEAADKVAEERTSPWYDEAEEDFRDNFYGDADLESEWLEHEGISTMQDVQNNYDITWPHYYNPNTGGEVSVEDAADSFSRAVGREVQASQNYHSRSVTRPSATKLHYVVEPDGSLEADDPADGGLEFVSPALPVDELLSDLKKVKAWADSTGCYTNDSTGLHINVSVPAWQGDLSKLDYVKLAVLMGDEYVLQEFGRQGNTYAKSALKIVKDNIRQRPEDVKRLLDTMKEHLNTSAAKLIHSGSTNKYTSVNTKDGYIEFRSPGGDWLNENFDKIENTLLRFVVAMDAAVDETKYKEEYAKKLYKLLAGDQKDATNTMAYFAKYAAGELPQSALKSFIKQAQFERSIGKEPNGKKMWYRVDKEGRGRSGASIEVVATSKEEALEKAASNWSLRLSSLTAADAYPVRPYKEDEQSTKNAGQHKFEIYRVSDGRTVEYNGQPLQVNADNFDDAEERAIQVIAAANLGAPELFNVRTLLQPPAQSNTQGSVGDYKIYRRADNSVVHTFQAGGNMQAQMKFDQWLEQMGGDRRGYAFARIDQTAPISGSTQDLQQQRAAGGAFTGAWKILDANGNEIYRFSGIGNNQSDANRVAVNWLRNNGYEHGTDISVVPIMS